MPSSDEWPEVAGIRVDPDRLARTGLPEVVWAEGKSDDQLMAAVDDLRRRSGMALVSRLAAERAGSLALRSYDEVARVGLAGDPLPPCGGRIAIVTAGAADRPVAREAAAAASALGCDVRLDEDCGVAGLHRLAAPLAAIRDWPADVVVVVAGTDGALAGVVSGLVAAPVIAVPTSTGYGAGGRGEAALLTMLQACTGGVLVVNIDAGVPAGLSAARIARAAALARDAQSGLHH
jgi:hypothetical protein